jgi:hypothetical protein
LRYSWTAGPDATTTTGAGERFFTSFTRPGAKTITLRVCSGGQGGRPEYCDDLAQPITVAGVERCQQYEISGSWSTSASNGYNATFTFHQTGTIVRGSAVLPAAEQTRAGYASPSGPFTGSLVGDQLDVTVTWTRSDGSVLQGRYTGTVSSTGPTQGRVSGTAAGPSWAGSGPLRCPGQQAT